KEQIKKIGYILGIILLICPDFMNLINFKDNKLMKKPNETKSIDKEPKEDHKNDNIQINVQTNEVTNTDYELLLKLEHKTLIMSGLDTAKDFEEKANFITNECKECMFKTSLNDNNILFLITEYAFSLRGDGRKIYWIKYSELDLYYQKDLKLIMDKRLEEERLKKIAEAKRKKEEEYFIELDSLLEEQFTDYDLLEKASKAKEKRSTIEYISSLKD